MRKSKKERKNVRGTITDGSIDEDGVVKSREALGNNGSS